jgi:hypothetical protein
MPNRISQSGTLLVSTSRMIHMEFHPITVLRRQVFGQSNAYGICGKVSRHSLNACLLVHLYIIIHSFTRPVYP